MCGGSQTVYFLYFHMANSETTILASYESAVSIWCSKSIMIANRFWIQQIFVIEQIIEFHDFQIGQYTKIPFVVFCMMSVPLIWKM